MNAAENRIRVLEGKSVFDDFLSVGRESVAEPRCVVEEVVREHRGVAKLVRSPMPEEVGDEACYAAHLRLNDVHDFRLNAHRSSRPRSNSMTRRRISSNPIVGRQPMSFSIRETSGMRRCMSSKPGGYASEYGNRAISLFDFAAFRIRSARARM